MTPNSSIASSSGQLYKMDTPGFGELRGRLLVVDDFPYDREYLTRALEAKGHVVVQAETGEDAMDILAQQHCDLVLLDSKLPGMEGLEVLAAIREKRSQLGLPVIMVTGMGETESVVEALRLGANDYLTKPVDIEILAARVNTQLSITQLRSALQSARDFSESLIASAAEMIVATNLERDITLFNHAAEEKWGYGSAEVIGKHIDILFNDPRRTARIRSTVLEKGKYAGELECRHKNGGLFTTRLTASQQRDKFGNPLGIIGMMLDLTELRRLEREKEELLHNKEQFMAMASHDLKNPLTSIEGFAKLLAQFHPQGSTMTEQGSECVQMILDNVTRMEKIIQDFLDFHSLEEGRLWLAREMTQLDELCAQVVHANRAYAEGKKIHLVLDVDASIPPVHADPHRVERVVRNLVGNAIKFCPHDCEVRVKVRAMADSVEVAVSDNGPGLSKKDLGRVFKSRGRLSAKPTGGEKSSGMGLPICKQLIELHDGEIGAFNNPDKGATFWFRIPVMT